MEDEIPQVLAKGPPPRAGVETFCGDATGCITFLFHSCFLFARGFVFGFFFVLIMAVAVTTSIAKISEH